MSPFKLSTIRAHLHVMKRLVFALRDQAFREVIHRAESRQEILQECRRVESGLVTGGKTTVATEAGVGSAACPIP